MNFIKANLDDAQALADQLKIPVQFVLAVSIDESDFRRSNIAMQAHNYFGIHTGGANSTGTYTTSQGLRVSSYTGSDDPYFDSGQDFVNTEVGNRAAFGATTADKFFTAIHDQYGLGATTEEYVNNMRSIARITALRITCP